MIHVCYGLMDRDGKYSKFLGLSIMSILQNSRSPIQIHILHDSTLSRENRHKLLAIDSSIEFYNLETRFPDLEERIRRAYKHSLRTWSNAAVYRLLIPEILDIEKTIYLDCDTIINLDLSELWEIDLKNYPIAAKSECAIFPFEISSEIRQQIDYQILYPKQIIRDGRIAPEDYFNSGVLVMNLPKLSGLFDSSLEFLRQNPDCIYIDQDPLNFLFSDRYLKLDPRFDIFTWQLRKFLKLTDSTLESGDCIFHFGGMDYGFDKKFLPDRIFMQTLFRSPWALESFKNLFDYSIARADESKARFQSLINFQGSRIFFAPKDLLGILTEFFPPRENDLLLDSDTPLEDLIELIRGDRICIFLFEFAKQSQIFRETLAPMGFIEDRELFDAMKMLTRDQGVSVGTRDFVRKM